MSDFEIDVEAMVAGYVEAMLWAECACDDPEGYDDRSFDDLGYTFGDVHPDAMEQARETCRQFCERNAEDVVAFMEETDRPEGHVGHDLWLTRQGHGAGFWDRGAGAVGDRLADAARVLGPAYPYLDDDDLVRLG